MGFKRIYCPTADDARKKAKKMIKEQGYRFGGSHTKRGIFEFTVTKGLVFKVVLQAPNN